MKRSFVVSSVLICIVLSIAVFLRASGIVPAIVPQLVPAGNKQGNSTKFQLAGTISGLTGSTLCTDASGNSTDTGCTGGAVVSALFTNLNDITATASGTTLSLIDPAGNGSNTIAGNYFVTGKTMTIDVGGTYTTTATPGTITFRATLDGTNIIASTATLYPSASQTSSGWFAHVSITCRSGGASGVLVGSGHIAMGDGGLLNSTVNDAFVGTLGNFNLTVSHTVTFSLNWGSTGQSITARTLVINPL